MTNSSNEQETETPNALRKGILVVLLFIIVVGAAFFIPYGSFRWWEAWLLLSLWLLYFTLMATVTHKHSPGVVEERANALSRFTQWWDKLIIGIYQIASLSLYAVAGLDRGRFHWTMGFPSWLKWIAFVGVIIVYALPYWAILSNPFTSGVVRIQDDREHQVIEKGPYRWIRHPMYLGTVIYGITFPLFLESLWALIPGIIVIVLFMIRTALEDRYLRESLPGYREYAERVRHRLFPGIW
jgi:protein-S-isoprenylcysteine O-methyltransferase Ste14